MGKKFAGDRPTIEEIRKLRQPRTETVGLPLDSDLLERIDEIERNLIRVRREDERLNREPLAPQLEAELEQLRADAEEQVVLFTFQELPRKQYRALMDSHPAPSKGLRFDPETFAPALISQCCIAPEMGYDDAIAIWEGWSEAATNVLFGAAIAVNEGQTKVPFGATGIGRTADSGPSSTTAVPEDSDTLDS